MQDWSERRIDRRRLLRDAAGLALGATVIGTAAGCGGSSGSSGGSGAAGGGSGGSGSKKVVAKPDGDLLFFNWAQYTSPKVIAGFEKQYGVKVHQSNFDNMEGMVAKLNAGVKYDVTFPEAATAQKLIKAGKLMELDHAQLKNWDEVVPYFHAPWYDKGARYTVPYTAWETGIGWRSDKVSGLKGSWNDLWDHPEMKGKIWLLDDLHEVMGMSLIRLGFSPNTTDKGELDKATQELLKLKPLVRGFTSVNNQFINGQGLLMHIWSGQVWQTINQVKNPATIRYEKPREGTPLNSDTVAILKDAPHPGTALLFVDWLLKPENVVENINYMGYPQPTKSGLESYNTITKKYPFLSIDTNEIEKAIHYEPLSPQALASWNADWTKIRA